MLFSKQEKKFWPVMLFHLRPSQRQEPGTQGERLQNANLYLILSYLILSYLLLSPTEAGQPEYCRGSAFIITPGLLNRFIQVEPVLWN
jgi:hypothetical protein